MKVWWTALVVGLASCATSATIPCGDHVCPPDTTCDVPTGLCIPALCGNDQVSGTEECDGAFGDTDCTDHGFYFPDGLVCSPVCTVDTSGCTGTCGDHQINGPETCDGIPPAGVGCADFGFDVGQLGCSGACTPAFAGCASIGWTPMPGGATTELHAIASTPRTAMAVGLGGTILENLDGVWIPMASPTTEHLYGIWLLAGAGTAPDTGYAVGAKGTVLFFNGAAWSTMSSGVTVDLFAVAGSDASTVYAVGGNGTILELAGSAWVKVATGTTDAFRGVWAGPARAFAVGDAGTSRARMTNGTWAVVPALPSSVLHLDSVSAADDVVFVAGAATAQLGLVAKYEGGSWSQIPMPKDDDVQFSIVANTKTDVWITGQNGGIVHWNGTDALRADTGTSRTIYGITMLGPARGFAVTRGGEVLGYNGTSRTTQPYARTFIAAARVTDGAIAVGPGGGLLRYDGERWTIISNTATNLPFLANMTTVFADGTRVLAGAGALASGATGGIFISTDDGATFNEVSTGSASVSGIAGAAGDYYAVADKKIHRSTNGTDWAQVATIPDELHGVWGLPDGSAFYAVGQDSGNGQGVVYRGKGATWTKLTVPPGPQLNSVWGLSATNIYAVGSYGTVLHYDGTTWHAMYTGTGELFMTVHGTSAQDIFVGGVGIRYHFDGVGWSRMSNPEFRDTFAVLAGFNETLFVGGFLGAEVFSRTCTAREERCDDPWDNDCDGLVNCADDDCDTPSCRRGGACETASLLACGSTTVASTYTGIARIDDLPCLDRSTPGPEASYAFVAQSSQPVTVTLAETTEDPVPVLDLVVVGATRGACDLQSCTPATATSDGRSVTFTPTAGQVYYIVVDGPLYTARDFTLSIDCQ
jgi:hypothetical protein